MLMKGSGGFGSEDGARLLAALPLPAEGGRFRGGRGQGWGKKEDVDGMTMVMLVIWK